jgi:DNA helicase-2/ATP-dependent DNA helicase PcrA
VDADQLLAGLDPEQRHAVTTPSQPLVIRAGAGSGKTRVLTRRLAHRAAGGDLDPRRALCVTFTRDAASELRSRLRGLGLRDLPAAGTFHAIALGLLRTRWHDLRQTEPTLLTDRSSLLRRIAGTRVDPATLARVGAEIDWARSRSVRPDRYADARRRSRRPVGVDPGLVASLYDDLEAAKRKGRLVDFDDLLERCTDAFRRDESFAEAQRWRFRHLFVDEFQDVNPLQFKLLQAWLGPNRDLCAVGDANQAIYGWNGADPTLFDRLTDLLDGGETVELTTNHRSSPAVVAVSGAALEPGRAPKASPRRPDAPAPQVLACRDDDHELATIAAVLRRWHDQGVAWRHQAVLARTNAQVRSLTDGLSRAGLPVARSGADRSSVRSLPAVPPGATFDEYVDQLTDPSLVALAEEYAALDLRPSPTGFLAWAPTAISDDDAGDTIRIGTFHRAKGREWQAVVVAGVEDGFVPASTARIDEERRLFYVALSRATDLLVCTWAASRPVRGRPAERQPSPFLAVVAEAAAEAERAQAPRPMPATVRAAVPGNGGPSPIRPGRPTRAGAPGPVAPIDLGRHRTARRAEALRAWRAAQARLAAVPPHLVLDDPVLDALAADPPGDLDELAARTGVGPLRARRFGPGLLRALTDLP